MKIMLATVLLFGCPLIAQEIHLRPRAPQVAISEDMPLQILSEGVNVQLGDIRSRLTDIGGDVKQLRRDVDRQSVVVSMFTFTARTALVVILTFALTMFLEFGKEKAKRLRARS